MDNLFQRVQEDLKQARKQPGSSPGCRAVHDRVRDQECGTIEKRADLSDEDEVERVLTKAVKKRREAAEQMGAAGRTELAEKERWEAEVLQEYLPPPLTEDSVREMVRQIIAGGAGQMGQVMGALMPRLAGRFDGKEAGRIVREELAG